MEAKLYTAQYDEYLQSKLQHLQNYPELLPHIGCKYKEAPKKILLIGESHYVEGESIAREYIDNWYDCSSVGLGGYRHWINTREVINRADLYVDYQKGLRIFYNVKAVLKEQVAFLSNQQLVFPYLAFYNFFQRPAFIAGQTIISTELDNNIAYNTFKLLLEILHPDLIIFTSRKSFTCYNWLQHARNEVSLFQNYNIGNVPHPASKWWNTKNRNYAIDGVPITGREKFIHLIKSIA